MCGIFGFSNTTPLTTLMTGPLAIYMNERGSDSWGVTDGEMIFKEPSGILDTFAELGLDGPTYHTRGASVGDVTHRNAHPFKVEGPNITVIGVHNGHISNHKTLATKYNRPEIQVDSEHIFYHLANQLSLADIDGWGNVVWYEYPNGKPEKRTRYFSRFKNEALHLAKMTTGEVVFASTQGSIYIAAQLSGGDVKHFYKTDVNHKYSITHKGVLMDHGALDWGKDIKPVPVIRTTPFTANGWGGKHGKYNGGFVPNLCAMKNCSHFVLADMLICQECFTVLADEYMGVAA